MDYFNDANWVEVPENSNGEEAAKLLADAGAVSSEPSAVRKKRVKKVIAVGSENVSEHSTSETMETSGVSGSGTENGIGAGIETAAETNTENVSETNSPKEDRRPKVYTDAACDAFKFLSRYPESSFVYFNSSWRHYDPAIGWHEIPDEFMTHEIVDYLVENQYKVDKNEAGKILLALTHFCKIRTPFELFEPVFFLENDRQAITAEHSAGWVACENAVFHLPSVALALYHGAPFPEDKILPLSSSLFIPGRIPCRLDPEAVCPTWDAFIESACPDDALSLQELFGLSLTYDRSYNAFFVIYGPSGTGKSTCLNVLQRLNQGTVSQVSLGRFGERFYIYPLSQNRVNLVHDMDSIYEGDGSVSLREAVLKSVASGESLEIERKHRHAQREYLRSLCVFGTNSLPRFADKSDAISQRMRIIQFPHVFRGEEGQIRSLHDLLFKELDGILLWALRGYGELLASGRNSVYESESSAELKLNAIKDSRPEIQFCDECLEYDDFSGWVSTLEIYKAYDKFCSARGYIPAGMSKVIPLIVAYMKVEPAKRVRIYGRLVTSVKGFSLAGKDEF